MSIVCLFFGPPRSRFLVPGSDFFYRPCFSSLYVKPPLFFYGHFNSYIISDSLLISKPDFVKKD